MACASCGGVILFGGERANGRRYCNEQCREAGRVLDIADQVPDELVAEATAALHEGPCPNCGGPGPVDVHTAHTAWSAVVMTGWKSSPQLCCRRCGRAAKLKAIAFTGALGWWGIPWGLIATPVQVGRNLVGLVGGPDPARPSRQLENIARMEVAGRAAQRLDDERAEKRANRVQFRRAERAAERQADGQPGA